MGGVRCGKLASHAGHGRQALKLNTTTTKVRRQRETGAEEVKCVADSNYTDGEGVEDIQLTRQKCLASVAPGIKLANTFSQGAQIRA